MRPNIDFTECLKDSPKFRSQIDQAQSDIDLLEKKLEKLVGLCSGMIEAGKHFDNANSAFITGLRDVADVFKEDDFVSEVLIKVANGITELQKYHHILLDQANRSVCVNINNFIKNEIVKVKETRRYFDKISFDLDAALLKNSQQTKTKPQECEDTANNLTAYKSCFKHTSLDYVFQINVLHSKKRFDVLDTMLAYMHAQNAFFHQGHDLFNDIDPYLKQVATQLEELNAKAELNRRAMDHRHSLVQMKTIDDLDDLKKSHDSAIKMEGYLFKRTSNAFKTWVRRWFMIKNNQLVYCKRTNDAETVMEEDLRLCNVKTYHDTDRRFWFEVVSPTRSHMLQADSEKEREAWINAIQAGVSEAYRNAHEEEERQSEMASSAKSLDGSTTTGSSSTATPKGTPPTASKPKRMQQILAIRGNSHCCDCGHPEPRWASINLGITLCIECSGIHRSFGVHKSKVKSVTLDSWEPELLKVMGALGNEIINSIFEANVDEEIAKRATPSCNRAVREAWIRAKYINKSFIQKLPNQSDSTGSTEPQVRRWSVYKRKRRSPQKADMTHEPISETGSAEPNGDSSIKTEDNGAASEVPTADQENKDTKSDVAMNEEAQMAAAGAEGQGRSDVLIFGAGVTPMEDDPSNFDLPDSEESELEVDTQSITSYEDLSYLNADKLLFRAAQARNLPVMMEALSLNANPNWQCLEEDMKTPLMKAVESGSMASVELLLLNNSKVDLRDARGRSALHHATVLGHTGQVVQLMKRHASQKMQDEKGQTPLDIALTLGNADIVTILRLFKLEEETLQTEGGGGDETFTEVVRDYTNQAYNQPEPSS